MRSTVVSNDGSFVSRQISAAMIWSMVVPAWRSAPSVGFACVPLRGRRGARV
jgi:hypothetical protein